MPYENLAMDRGKLRYIAELTEGEELRKVWTKKVDLHDDGFRFYFRDERMDLVETVKDFV